MHVDEKIRVAIIGVGNCASALVQGLTLCSKSAKLHGVLNTSIAGYDISRVEVVCAFDIDQRKVGFPVEEAIFSPPNNSLKLCDPPLVNCPVEVHMGRVLDGLSEHLRLYPPEKRIVLAKQAEPDRTRVVEILRSSGAHILINFLPVGSEEATCFYMECALEAGVGVVNCIPVFIASDPAWERKFVVKKVPIVGDDIKSQFGATIVHRTLTELARRRGIEIKSTYQLNVGGNSDFLNMLDRTRLASKKISKTEAVTSALEKDLPTQQVHVGPSDYVPWLNDNKICFIRMDGFLFGGAPLNMELRLSVEDSPNSAGIVVDAIRYCKIALDRGVGGAIRPACASLMKHPPQQMFEHEAEDLLARFVDGEVKSVTEASQSNLCFETGAENSAYDRARP